MIQITTAMQGNRTYQIQFGVAIAPPYACFSVLDVITSKWKRSPQFSPIIFNRFGFEEIQ
ncbi:hypothetical protein [Fischerella thermalis]|uniref:Uncharacterized protein n=1 Tax=Fischerella thermalis CCMEE 5318 TaxID=2019666 RepID=A0A2N6L4N1_9CYAN|nr:hypothetical protein [Fischerella thermalis]PMB15549.1 hypothetical protein CEN46_25680 [Fischerella thermalis CCMEE 5318]